MGLVDFETVYLNREVATLKVGTPFGDLALLSETDKRNASIRMKKHTVLAYLDRNSYNMVMKKVIKRNTQQKMKILRSNKLFDRISLYLLAKLELNVIHKKMVLNQVIYKEGEPVDGMYLIVKGSVKYRKLVD